MENILPIVAPVTWLLCGLAFVLFLMNSLRPTRVGGTVASLLLLLATALLVGSAAIPQWLPHESVALSANTVPSDPRVVSAYLLAVAALAGLFGGIRSLKAPSLALVGFWAQGIVLGGLAAAAGYMAGLHSSPALAGLGLGGLLFGTALALASRRKDDRSTMAAATLAVGVAAVVVAALVSIHGGRVSRVAVAERSSVDTLGFQLRYVSTSAPHDSLRLMRMALTPAKGAAESLTVAVLGRTGPHTTTTAGGGTLAGPLVVPIALEELQSNPHGVVWVKKGEEVTTASGTVRFKAFRFEMGKPIKLFADLEVEHGGRTVTASPGMTASDKGEAPLPVTVEGFGPIAVAAIDADNGRVGLMLPSGTTTPNIVRTVLLELRTRPLLPGVWIGGALALVGFLLVLASPPARRAASASA